MSRRHIISLLTVFLLFLGGCGGSYTDIVYRNGRLSLQLEKGISALKASTILEKKTNFVSLFLQQSVLALKEGNLVVFENARTDLSYEFEPMLVRTVGVVFETRKRIPLFYHDHLYVCQLILSDGHLLNLIAWQYDSQQLKLLYGMSNQELAALLQPLVPDLILPFAGEGLKLYHPKDAILTHWDDRKVHFYPLVVPLPRLMMGY